jgi:hypothetical protein
MGDVEVRQWGPGVYAAYVDFGGPYPDFVGTEMTRDLARRTGERVRDQEGMGAGDDGGQGADRGGQD